MIDINIQYFGGRGGGGSGGARGKRGSGGAGAAKSSEKNPSEKQQTQETANKAKETPKTSSRVRKPTNKEPAAQSYTLQEAKNLTYSAPNGTKLVNENGTIYIKQSWQGWSCTSADGRTLSGVGNESMAKRLTKGTWKRSMATQRGSFGNWR